MKGLEVEALASPSRRGDRVLLVEADQPGDQDVVDRHLDLQLGVSIGLGLACDLLKGRHLCLMIGKPRSKLETLNKSLHQP